MNVTELCSVAENKEPIWLCKYERVGASDRVIIRSGASGQTQGYKPVQVMRRPHQHKPCFNASGNEKCLLDFIPSTLLYLLRLSQNKLFNTKES